MRDVKKTEGIYHRTGSKMNHNILIFKTYRNSICYTLTASLDYLRTMPCGLAEYCWLSYEPENIAAKSMYTSMGFRENGELCGDEIVSVIKL